MAIKSIKNLKDEAEHLYLIRREIEKKEEEFRDILNNMKLQRDDIQDNLLRSMSKNGLDSIRLESGDSFYKGSRKGVEITSDAKAFDWAYRNKAVSIDKIIVGQLLKEAPEIPEGFKLVETEFISVRKAKQK